MSKKWYEIAGNDADVIISTRARLARNVKGYPFTGLLTPQGLWQITEKVLSAMKPLEDSLNAGLHYLPLETQTSAERAALVEQHLISPAFAKGDGALMLSKDHSISIMIGEEDHLRLQVLAPGFDLQNTYSKLSVLEEGLSQNMTFAFDDTLGYLTQCPTNLGCALRVSVMAYLPALEHSGALQAIIKRAHSLGLAIRGFYGEGSAASGSLYQISNERSLGLSEEQILQNVGDMVHRIIQAEREARRTYLTDRAAFEDRVWQAYGILRYGRLLSYSRTLELCGLLRQGIGLGFITDIDYTLLSKMIVTTGAGAICAAQETDLTPRQRDWERAKVVRDMLQGEA